MKAKKTLIKAVIDGKTIEVDSGTTLLEAAERLGITIPTLCYHKDLPVSGSCRMCVVEVEGQRTLQTACSYPITQEIKVKTSSSRIRRARRNTLALLLSEHVGDCYACGRNRNCELQTLAEEYGIDEFPLGHKTQKTSVIEQEGPIVRDKDKCILCGRCVRTCRDMQEVGAIEVMERSDRTFIGTFEDTVLANTACVNCGQCINRCPTGALTERDDTDKVWEAIDDPTKHVVIQTAPAPRAGIGECFGLEPGKPLTFQMNTALRKIGFDKVFDTNFTADLTILEEGTELLKRLYQVLVKKDASIKIPQFTSCSPGWIKYIEYFYPEFLSYVSSAKSPQQMFGAIIKTYYAKLHNLNPADIVSVSLMPCTAKKFECDRPEFRSSGYKDLDYALTTREVAKMIKEGGVYLPDESKSDFDEPFGTATGSGVIFGATGGVMEAALRTVIELVLGIKVENLFDHADILPVRGFEGIRYVELPITQVGPVPELLKPLFPSWDWLKGATLKAAVVHGTANAKKVLEDIKAGGKFSECHFIEFMACPGGCLGGGGQPIPTNAEIRQKRAKAIYEEDSAYPVRKSHENPAVLEIYKNFLTEGPCGHRSHELLHTHYISRRQEK